MTINAGGVIALLAFVGTIAGKKERVFESIQPFILPMTLFGLGLICAAIASGGMYFAQACFANVPLALKHDFVHPYVHKTPKSERWTRVGKCFQYGNIAFGLASLILFIVALYSCRTLLMTARL
jgi:hypothetical protein